MFNEPICPKCDDFRRVKVPGSADSAPCPSCGTDEGRRRAFTLRARIPELAVRDLSGEDLDLFRLWRSQGHHELDCLRWIEGRHYRPESDKAFLRDCFLALAEWREATSRVTPAPPEARPEKTQRSPDPPVIARSGATSQAGKGLEPLPARASLTPPIEESTTYAKTPEKQPISDDSAESTAEEGPW